MIAEKHVVPIAKEIVRVLVERREKLVLAESCTAGFLCALLGQVPGVSECLCGSFVTYRAGSKRDWLGVKSETIEKYTTESIQVAEEMARGALYECEEADWSLAVVGHFGPGAPAGKDGQIHFCIAYGPEAEIAQRFTYTLTQTDRIDRQRFAAEMILTYLGRCLVKAPQNELTLESNHD